MRALVPTLTLAAPMMVDGAATVAVSTAALTDQLGGVDRLEAHRGRVELTTAVALAAHPDWP